MLQELAALGERFDNLDKEVHNLTRGFMQRNGITEEMLQSLTEKMLSGATPPHNPECVAGSVEIVAAYDWRPIGEGGTIKSKLILASDDGRYLVLGEKGLCFGPHEIPAGELFAKETFAKALPAKIKPRPKSAASWNYMIPLANNYQLRVRLDELNGKPLCRFALRRAGSNSS